MSAAPLPAIDPSERVSSYAVGGRATGANVVLVANREYIGRVVQSSDVAVAGSYPLDVEVLQQLIRVYATTAYPVGTLLKLAASSSGGELRFDVVDVLELPAASSAEASRDRGMSGSFTAIANDRARIESELIRVGHSADAETVEHIRSLLVRHGLALDRGARIAADLLAIDSPVDPAWIRGALHVESGGATDVEPLSRELIQHVLRELPAGTARDEIIELVERGIGAAIRDAQPEHLRTRPELLLRALEKVLDAWIARDPVLAGLRATLDAVERSGSDSTLGASQEELQDLAQTNRSLRAADEPGFDGLSERARRQAVRLIEMQIKRRLADAPELAEFRSVGRELVTRAEAQSYLQWLEWNSLADSGLATHLGAWVWPDERFAFRLAVDDQRQSKGSGEALGFRIDVESRVLGSIVISGDWSAAAPIEYRRGQLALDFEVEQFDARESVRHELGALTSRLADVGYSASAGVRRPRTPRPPVGSAIISASTTHHIDRRV